MAADESSEGKPNLVLQTVNVPPTVKIKFTGSLENALDKDYIHRWGAGSILLIDVAEGNVCVRLLYHDGFQAGCCLGLPSTS